MSALKQQSLLREASHQIIAGGSAGLVEICLMHPLDVVKTRFQIQRSTSDPNAYKGLGDCFRTIFRNEGVYGFYKGILPPILAETPKRAVKFFTFEQYKKLLSFTPLSAGMSLSVAGLFAGLTEAIVVNPFEVVKVSLQANRDSFKVQPSTFAQARHIIQSDGLGLRGLNKGLTSTLGRHGVFNMIYFGFYFNVKDAIPASQDPTVEFVRKFAIGLTSGTISSADEDLSQPLAGGGVSVKEFSFQFPNMTQMRQKLVSKYFILPFLSRNASDPACVSSTNGSVDWLHKNFGPFSVFVPLKTLLALNQDLSPVREKLLPCSF